MLAPGEGFEPSRPNGHRLSRPAPYQARRSRLAYLKMMWGILRLSRAENANTPSLFYKVITF